MTSSPAGGWHRLHPLSPLARSGRATLGVLVLIGISATGEFGKSGSHLYEGIAAAVIALGAVINWLVTRWKLDGATLCIETGLLRRDSRQLPVARIQAVDVARPFLARALGLAELRVPAGRLQPRRRPPRLPDRAGRARPAGPAAGRAPRPGPGHARAG